MKICIAGHGEGGKDDAAKYLVKHAGFRYKAGTSWYARHYVFDWFASQGVYYTDALTCWQDRRDHRKIWADCIAQINEADGAALYRECLADGNDILTGIRQRREMEAVKRANLVDVWVWIETGKRVPVDPTQEYGSEACNLSVNNTGTLAEYEQNLRALTLLINYGKEPYECLGLSQS